MPAPAGTGTATTAKVDVNQSTPSARRCAAARRMPPLSPCGCVRDPVYDRHRCDGEISDHMAEAAIAAVAHLDRLGIPGLLDTRTCRDIWRLGFRRLAHQVHRRSSGVA